MEETQPIAKAPIQFLFQSVQVAGWVCDECGRRMKLTDRSTHPIADQVWQTFDCWCGRWVEVRYYAGYDVNQNDREEIMVTLKSSGHRATATAPPADHAL